jgi:hypothetical protein
VSIRSGALFLPNGKASPLLFSQWRVRAPDYPLQAGMVLVDGGLPTQLFIKFWREAFPDRTPLPHVRIANGDGTGTTAFWTVFQ